MILDELSLNIKSVQTILLHHLGIQKIVCQNGVYNFVGRPETNFVKTCWRKLKMIQIFLGRSSQEIKIGFSNMILKQRGKACSGDCRITQTQEGTHVKIKNQGHADEFFSIRSVWVSSYLSKFVPKSETVNQHFYQQVLICLHNQV